MSTNTAEPPTEVTGTKTGGVEQVSPNKTTQSGSSSVVNKSHHGIKRIMSEMRELQKNPSPEYEAHPLEDNLFEWHFTIAGPKESAFEGGIYHGRIILPPEYPHKPPDIVLLTPSGRFEVNTKICLSLTSYHPESWTPQWGIRTVLIALQGFFPTEAKGIGSIDYPDSVRKRMANQSRKWKCDVCGTCNDEVLKTPQVVASSSSNNTNSNTTTATITTNNTSETIQTSTSIIEESTCEEKRCCNNTDHTHHHYENKVVSRGGPTPQPATTTKPSVQKSGESNTKTVPKKSTVWILDLLIVLVAILISYIVYIRYSSSGRR
ncbi:UBCc domain-containing protein [Naegleria gruberi]|uniref:UBCc domain-containing protein n=1 Tax=Naegleria gruberi TaxID=5762 RepID=D2UZK2_NAEGR|nr:UBCc domain-containing protein [Naegleria gruberi]EFC49957.1 UBCc domain-containing protein [Naegleria gruberi]|eukprot:XP_002682701.1 UBCc domain-containing protein [Naegleria gruberi strain NEG-M]